MMRRLYDWMMRMAVHPNAPHALFGVAFVESSIFPIPPDVMLVPMILAARNKAWTYANICLIASVLGGLVGYAIGYYLFAYVGEPVLNLYGLTERYAQARTMLAHWGPWILIAKGFTPFPYKVLTIAAGVFKMGLAPFILASIVARAMRFYLVAGLLYWFGDSIRAFVERRLGLVTTAFIVLLVGGLVAVRFVF
jgi:membrane protein YqaA with SNARE-associated domain